jgi:hypothetical protein
MMRHRPLSVISILLFTFMVALAFMGCRDKCKRTVCVNGTCVEGVCNCNTGYFKEDCNTVINAGYNGIWSLTEECLAGSDLYDVVIRPATGSLTELFVVGLWEQAGDTVSAAVSSSGKDITIERQAIGNVEISAEGLANDNQDEITLTYEVYNPGQSQPFDVCTATLEKQ